MKFPPLPLSLLQPESEKPPPSPELSLQLASEPESSDEVDTGGLASATPWLMDSIAR